MFYYSKLIIQQLLKVGQTILIICRILITLKNRNIHVKLCIYAIHNCYAVSLATMKMAQLTYRSMNTGIQCIQITLCYLYYELNKYIK